MSYLWRTLRSRRLAVATITTFAVFVIVATVIPQGTAAEVLAGKPSLLMRIAVALSLNAAYTSPLFLALLGVLLLCTSACALQRTRWALRIYRRLRSEGAGRPRKLPIEIPVASPALFEVQGALAKGLAPLGGKVAHLSDGSTVAVSGLYALFGSPTFHWSLVALMLIIGAGQATRTQGFLPLPLGERVLDQRESYLQVNQGVLGGSFSQMQLEAASLNKNLVVGGVLRPPTPYVKVTEYGIPIVSGYVYANHPLRFGTRMINYAGNGSVITVALEAAGGAEVARERFYFERQGSAARKDVTQEFDIEAGPGTPAMSVRVKPVRTVSSSTAGGSQVGALVATAPAGTATWGEPVTLRAGEAMDVSSQGRLRIADVRDWVRVSVVDDWSIPVVYSLLVVCISALAVALLVPTRVVWAILSTGDAGCEVRAGVWDSQRDPNFRYRVADALTMAASNSEEKS